MPWRDGSSEGPDALRSGAVSSLVVGATGESSQVSLIGRLHARVK